MTRAHGFVAVLLLGVLPHAARAQDLGLKGGMSYGNVSNSGLLPGELDHRTGFAGGLWLGKRRGPLTLGAEALYAERGVQSSTAGDSRELNYVDVPVYLRVALPIPGPLPFVYAGPQVSFELSCQAAPGDCPDTDRPKTSYAAVLGAGVRLGARGGLSVEGRYLYGLTDLKLSTVTSASSYKTRSFLLLVGVDL